MKRYVILINLLLLSLFSMIGCTNNDDQSNEQNNTLNDQVNESNTSETNQKSTSDPLEVIRDDSYEIFQHGSAELEIIGRYISEDSDSDGVIELEKNGYNATLALILVHSPVVNENSIYVLGEHENVNKDGGRLGIPESVIKTNEKEELRDRFTTGSIEPDSKANITNMIFLDEDSSPDTLEIMLKEPSIIESDNEEANMGDNKIKDWKRAKFHKK